MKRKILSLLVLLLMAVTGAWADNLYLTSSDGFATATLKYGTPDSEPNPYYIYTGGEWIDLGDNRYNITSITVYESCQNSEETSLLYLFFEFTKLTTINGLENLNNFFLYLKLITHLLFKAGHGRHNCNIRCL